VIGVASTHLPPSKPRSLTPTPHEEEGERGRGEYDDDDQDGDDGHEGSKHHTRGHTGHSDRSQFDNEEGLGDALLRGRRPLHQDMQPWEIACATGATKDGLLPPPPLRTYRWTFPEQNAHDRIGAVFIHFNHIHVQKAFFIFFSSP
jgi:hypothetical protein